MKYGFSAVLALALAAVPARAHFVWIVPGAPVDGKTTARVFLGEGLEPEGPELLAPIAGMQLFTRGPDGKTEPLSWTKGEKAYLVTVPSEGSRTIGGVCHYG